MREQALVNACLIYLRTKGCKVKRNNTGAMRIQTRGRRERFVRFGEPGWSDIEGCAPGGRAVYVECKRRPGKLTPAQADFLATMQQLGAFAMVAYEIEELIQAWEKHDANNP